MDIFENKPFTSDAEIRVIRNELAPVFSGLGLERYNEIADVRGETIIWRAPVEVPFYEGADFGFKGGVAKWSLKTHLGIGGELPRDIDALQLNQGAKLPPGWDPESHLSEFSSIEDFLRTRDITQNEVVILPSQGDFELFATTEAVVDTLNNIYCPSLYERDDAGQVRSRIATRLIRFAAESLKRNNHPTVVLTPDDIQSLSYFDLALQFERAREKECTEQYLRICRKFELVPDKVLSSADMLIWLQEELEFHGNDFVFSLETIGEFNKDLSSEPAYRMHLLNFGRINKLVREDRRLSLDDFEIASF